MNTKNIWLFVGILIAVVLAGFFFLRKPATNSLSSPTPTSSEVTNETQEQGVVEEDGEPITEIEVSGKEFSFSPSTISVKRGDKVRIVFKNVGKMTHNFVVEELDIRTSEIAPGETDTIEFTVPDDGSSLTYYCSVGSHRVLGMEGKFSVE